MSDEKPNGSPNLSGIGDQMGALRDKQAVDAAQHAEEIPPFVVEVKTYHNHEGKELRERVPISGVCPFARFMGAAHLRLQVQTKQGVLPHEDDITFGIEVETVAEAFAKYDARAQEATNDYVENMKREMMQHQQQQQGKIEVVPEAVLKRMTGPDGQPLA